MPIERITVRPAEGLWVVRAGGAVIGESMRALALVEDGHPPVIYFPRDDLAMAFLEPSDSVTTRLDWGEARHFGIAAKSGLIADAAWSYETPADRISRIACHIAFYDDKAVVEQI
jgi:uncharacterized protein (DUF427 family)